MLSQIRKSYSVKAFLNMENEVPYDIKTAAINTLPHRKQYDRRCFILHHAILMGLVAKYTRKVILIFIMSTFSH